MNEGKMLTFVAAPPQSKTMRNMCDERELATLVRSLGYNPTQVRTV